MPIGRYKIANYNTELTIWNVEQSDEGDYRCRASNSNGAQDHVIQIDVQGELFIFMIENAVGYSPISVILLLSCLDQYCHLCQFCWGCLFI